MNNSFLDKVNFRFVSKTNEPETLVRPYKYYQLCSFINPNTKRYHLRRFVVNNKNEFVSIDNYMLDQNQYMRFVQTRPPNEYKLFNTYELNYVPYPSSGDLLISQSPILSTNTDYSGFAKFET